MAYGFFKDQEDEHEKEKDKNKKNETKDTEPLQLGALQSTLVLQAPSFAKFGTCASAT